MARTLEINEAVATAAERVAAVRGRSLNELTEEALTQLVKSYEQTLSVPVFKGGVPMPHQSVEWADNIRDAAYERDGE